MLRLPEKFGPKFYDLERYKKEFTHKLVPVDDNETEMVSHLGCFGLNLPLSVSSSMISTPR